MSKRSSERTCRQIELKMKPVDCIDVSTILNGLATNALLQMFKKYQVKCSCKLNVRLKDRETLLKRERKTSCTVANDRVSMQWPSKDNKKKEYTNKLHRPYFMMQAAHAASNSASRLQII